MRDTRSKERAGYQRNGKEYLKKIETLIASLPALSIFKDHFFAANNSAFVSACNASNSGLSSSFVFRSIRSMNRIPRK